MKFVEDEVGDEDKLPADILELQSAEVIRLSDERRVGKMTRRSFIDQLRAWRLQDEFLLDHCTPEAD